MSAESDTWSDLVRVLLDSHFNSLDKRLSEMDLRYQQRFDASQKALEAASLAAEKAVAAALSAAKEAVGAASISAEKSVSAALAAAEKAIEKAEHAQAQHNETQNEWRATVNDLTKNMAEAGRLNTQTSVQALSDQVDVSLRSLTDNLSRINIQLGTTAELARKGSANLLVMVAVAGVIAAFASIGVSIALRPAPLATITAPVSQVSPK